MKRKNLLSVTLSACMAAGMLTGCGSSGESGNGKGKVYWLKFKPEADEAL